MKTFLIHILKEKRHHHHESRGRYGFFFNGLKMHIVINNGKFILSL